jgi:hypothetical protein
MTKAIRVLYRPVPGRRPNIVDQLVDKALSNPDLELRRQEYCIEIAKGGDRGPLIKYLKEFPASPLAGYFVGILERKIRLPRHRPRKSLDRYRCITAFVLCLREMGASPAEAEETARVKFGYADVRNIRKIIGKHKDDWRIVGSFVYATRRGMTDISRDVEVEFQKIIKNRDREIVSQKLRRARR